MKNTSTNKIISLTPETESSERPSNPSDKLISPKSQDLLTRIGIYSLNIGSRLLCEAYEAKESIGNLAKESVEIGNFYGALGFATLDVLASENSKFKRLTKFGDIYFMLAHAVMI